MAYRNIYRDVKLAAIRLYQRRLLPLRLILESRSGPSVESQSFGDQLVTLYGIHLESEAALVSSVAVMLNTFGALLRIAQIGFLTS